MKFGFVAVCLAACSLSWAFAIPPAGEAGKPTAASPWCGAVTASGATVKARLSASGVQARLVVSEREGLAAPLFSPPSTSSGTNGNVVALTIAGLRPATRYDYALELNGIVDPARVGRFTTFPSDPASFRFAMGGDSDYRSDKYSQQVFDAIAAEDPLFFLFIGDLHYNDTNSARVEPYRANYEGVLAGRSFSRLLRSTSVVYVWDDHDCAGNATDRTRIGLPFAQRAYREYVPSYQPTNASGPINQAFTVGRARFIITDNRSAREPSALPDNAEKTILGSEQKAWFKNELLAAKARGDKVIFWVCSTPWIGQPEPKQDRWPSYTTERREIADFLKANSIHNFCILSADMHALAYDDGTNSDYATGGGMPIPVLHAAPLAKGGSRKGGPYSSGEPIQKPGQYGIVEVNDDGGPTISVTFFGKRFDAHPPTLLTYRFVPR